jgi:hypothetical protein
MVTWYGKYSGQVYFFVWIKLKLSFISLLRRSNRKILPLGEGAEEVGAIEGDPSHPINRISMILYQP